MDDPKPNELLQSLIGGWSSEYPGVVIGPWRPFPNIPVSDCDLCPPSRRMHFRARVETRWWMLGMSRPFGRMVRSKRLSRVLPWITLPFAVVIEIVFTGILVMKQNVPSLGLGAIVIAIVIFAALVASKAENGLTPLSSILLDVFIAAAVAGVTYRATKTVAEHDAKKRWLPFAESACSKLITISMQAERMRRTTRRHCSSVRSIMGQEASNTNIVAFIENQCEENADKLASLREQVKAARRDWEGFIRTHCEGAECEQIDSRLKGVEEDLLRSLENDTPPTPCGDAAPASEEDLQVDDDQ